MRRVYVVNPAGTDLASVCARLGVQSRVQWTNALRERGGWKEVGAAHTKM